MMRIERERTFVIQDRLAEISEAKPRIPQIVEQICAPLPGVDEILVAVDCFLEMSCRCNPGSPSRTPDLAPRERIARSRSRTRSRQQRPKIDMRSVSSPEAFDQIENIVSSLQPAPLASPFWPDPL